MGFEAKLALRYLISSRLQTSLLVAGVAVGVLVFTFIAALMNGLGVRLTEDITGTVAHVTLEPAPRSPRTYMPSPVGRALFAVQPGHDDAAEIRTYRSVLELAARMPGVRVAVPEVLGNATLKVFSLLTIAIGVASTLCLSVMRHRPEIGILRSFGIGRAAVVRTFVLQGVLIGILGSVVGVALSFAFAHLLLTISMTARGAPSIPIDPAQGKYLRAILFATAASACAAILPARSAAKTDPLEAIQS